MTVSCQSLYYACQFLTTTMSFTNRRPSASSAAHRI